jgi:hypothetical protein
MAISNIGEVSLKNIYLNIIYANDVPDKLLHSGSYSEIKYND